MLTPSQLSHCLLIHKLVETDGAAGLPVLHSLSLEGSHARSVSFVICHALYNIKLPRCPSSKPFDKLCGNLEPDAQCDQNQHHFAKQTQEVKQLVEFAVSELRFKVLLLRF